MGRAQSLESRKGVVAYVNGGNSSCEAAQHFSVSLRLVYKMIDLERASGSLEPARQGHPFGSVKLDRHREWFRERLPNGRSASLDELTAELADLGVEVQRSTVGQYLHSIGLDK